MQKRILITAGGTGGHIYPAQGFAQQIQKSSDKAEVLFVAGGLNSNRYFEHSLFPHQEVACSPLFSKNPLKMIKGVCNLLWGIYQSARMIRKFKPHVVVGFGSYYTLSTLLAAKLTNTPVVLHEANSIPGKANQWFAPYAVVVGVHFPSTIALLKGKSVEVGMPMREGYRRSAVSKEEACAYFHLNTILPILLIFGGSQGAKAINHCIKEMIAEENNLSFQVIHLTGDEKIVEEFKALYARHGIRACVKPFEKQMDKAWGAADLFIGRSGAGTIAEAMEFEVPGILIPYPYATENHQEKNADFFVHTVGGGIKLLEKHLKSIRLQSELRKLLAVDQRTQMQDAIHAYKERPGQTDLCQLVLDVLNERKL